MENQKMLFQAAIDGNVTSLQNLVQEDPLILDRIIANYFAETPLHVAAMLGHIGFVNEIINRKPELAAELNYDHSSPLHLASTRGYVEVVEALVSANHQICLTCDRNGLMPLHLAAMKGRVEVLEVLLQAQPDAVQAVLDGGIILHFCVNYYQVAALKLVVGATLSNTEFINSKDNDGNTALHLAVADKQVETVKFLLTVDAIKVNVLNDNGMTAMDILIRSRRDLRDAEIEEYLKRAGAYGATGNYTVLRIHQNEATQGLSRTTSDPNDIHQDKHSWERLLKQQDDWLEKKKSTLMIVASLIATMAFQVGINPPGGVWQDTDTDDSQLVQYSHLAGSSVLAYNYPSEYRIFLIINTTGFIAALSIILLLISGLPIKRKVFMWILMVITWISITSVALTYVIATGVLTPPLGTKSFVFYPMLGTPVLIWLGLMALLLVGHTIRLIVRTIRKLRKSIRQRRRYQVLQV